MIKDLYDKMKSLEIAQNPQNQHVAAQLPLAATHWGAGRLWSATVGAAQTLHATTQNQISREPT
jgi:hypothetical protein